MMVDFDGLILQRPEQSYIEKQHVMRYKFAAHFLRSHDFVLDIACGAGYGSHYLAQSVPNGKVWGVDLSPYALRFARENYGDLPNLSFCQGDAQALVFPSTYFDAVVSFETIEHLSSPENFLAEVKRILKPGGVFICSTPNAACSYHSAYHFKEYFPEEFFSLLGIYFRKVERYFQEDDLKERAREVLRRGYWFAKAKVYFCLGQEGKKASYFKIKPETDFPLACVKKEEHSSARPGIMVALCFS